MTAAPRVSEWWAEHPMTYGDTHGESSYANRVLEPGTREFFDEIDRRFYLWNRSLHGERPFDRLFPYDAYGPGSRVLEVGCGMGTMAMNWADAGASVTAVDVSATAVAQTRIRLGLNGLEGDVMNADAHCLPFADDTFDYAFSWGVLHHSPDIGRSVMELLRVVRPGGGFGIMLYNRRSLLYGYVIAYLEGYLHRERRFLSRIELASRYSDAGREEGNPYTQPVTKGQVLRILRPHTVGAGVRVLGTDLDGVLATAGQGLQLIVPRWAKKPWSRRVGWSLWFNGQVR